ncbi:MAG: phosphoenolpyruvate carboxykinase (GTP), partial [Casimicrobiaceae bacterium]
MNDSESFSALASSVGAPARVRHTKLLAWVREIAALTQPDRIEWSDGTEAEYARLCDAMVAAGTLHRLDPTRRPNSFLARSDPLDVARVE